MERLNVELNACFERRSCDATTNLLFGLLLLLGFFFLLLLRHSNRKQQRNIANVSNKYDFMRFQKRRDSKLRRPTWSFLRAFFDMGFPSASRATSSSADSFVSVAGCGFVGSDIVWVLIENFEILFR